MSEEKEGFKKLIMLISDLRAKDEERYEAHVNFMNETIKMIRAIESQMNKHWTTVLDSLKQLNDNISANLDSLLTGINPKGLRETSKSLKEIMDTMNRSIQSLNLEKIINELKFLKAGVNLPVLGQMPGSEQPEQISAGMNAVPGLKAPGASGKASAQGAQEEGWVDPNEVAKKKKKEEDSHLLRPSDFFGKG